MIESMRPELGMPAVDRSRAGTTGLSSSGARSASFEGTLRDLEHNLELMLDMPAVRSSNAVPAASGSPNEAAVERTGQANGALNASHAASMRLTQASVANRRPAGAEPPRREPTTHARGHANRVQRGAADTEALAVSSLESGAGPQGAEHALARVATVEPGWPAPGFSNAMRAADAPGARAQASGVRAQAPGVPGDAARYALAPHGPAESNVNLPSTRPPHGDLARAQMDARTVGAAPDASLTRASTRTAPAPSESNAARASVVSHVAADRAAIAIRVGNLSPRSADSLLDRVRELLRTHGVESYEVFLNGERVDLAPPSSGSRSWR